MFNEVLRLFSVQDFTMKGIFRSMSCKHQLNIAFKLNLMQHVCLVSLM